MYDSDREAHRYPAMLPPEQRNDGLAARPPGDDGDRTPDLLGEDPPARRPPCGGSCERFGVQGCHSPRCCGGGQ